MSNRIGLALLLLIAGCQQDQTTVELSDGTRVSHTSTSLLAKKSVKGLEATVGEKKFKLDSSDKSPDADVFRAISEGAAAGAVRGMKP